MTFAELYGPWALIAGASEGTGAAFSRQVAAQGLNCILIARRAEPLAALAEEIRAASGVECVTASVDLAKPDAFERISDIAGSREVGLFISNAGADPNGAKFLAADIRAWIDLIQRNIVTTIRCCHHFGRRMQERSRGGIILVGSGACYVGSSYMATYSGVKAFDLCFAEGLWAELNPHGVHVVNLVMTTTDTPALRKLLANTGVPLPPSLASAEDVAAAGLARLPYGPVHNFGLQDTEVGFASNSASQRRERVRMVANSSKSIFGDG